MYHSDAPKPKGKRIVKLDALPASPPAAALAATPVVAGSQVELHEQVPPMIADVLRESESERPGIMPRFGLMKVKAKPPVAKPAEPG